MFLSTAERKRAPVPELQSPSTGTCDPSVLLWATAAGGAWLWGHTPDLSHRRPLGGCGSHQPERHRGEGTGLWSTEELGAAGSCTGRRWMDRPPGARSGRERKGRIFRFQRSLSGGCSQSWFRAWDAAGPGHRKKIMMMKIMPPSKPLQGLWGERQELAGDGSSRQAVVQAEGQKWQQV